MNVPLRLAEYPDLWEYKSDLRACSLDDNGNNEDSLLFDYEGFTAVNFDGVMEGYCGELGAGTARSADALYVDERSGGQEYTVNLIEFKNGNLNERYRAPVSSKKRSEFKEELVSHIDRVLDKHVMGLMDKIDPLGRELKDAVEQCIGENFGRLALDKGQKGVNKDAGDGYRLETVKTKALGSALLLLTILEQPVSYIKERVNFILVYNPSFLSGDDKRLGAGDKRAAIHPSVDTILTPMLAKRAGRPASRFGLKQSLGAFFRDVLTLTPEELYEFLGSR